MKTSDAINEIAAALSKAQGEFPTIDRTETARIANEKANYSYRYATLAGVLEAVRAPLAKHGLAILQAPQFEAAKITITLLLLHESGQFFEDVFSMPCPLQTPQGIGSAISYARRYQLLAFLGLATDDDDDGATASQTSSQASQTRTQANRGSKPPDAAKPEETALITEEQVKAVTAICKPHGWDVDQTAQNWFQLSLANLTQAQAREMIKKLNKASADAKREAEAQPA